MNDLKLIVMPNIEKLGIKVDEYLRKVNGSKNSYIMDFKAERFNNGEGKVRIEETIRDKDVFILSDVGNYGLTYQMYGKDVMMSPDDHFQDIKRCISALSGYPSRITVIEPLLYQSRQDKRAGRESLDCAMALQELEALNVKHIITFDVHDTGVSNAIPKIPFENIYPTNIILEDLLESEDIDNLMVIAPDAGASKRASYFCNILNCDKGEFYKNRDYSKLVNGKNPIREHKYMGPDPKGKTCIVVDDMIASGASIIDVGRLLRDMNASKIIFITTFALFTEGIIKFDEEFKKKSFDKLYTTNLSYIPDEYLSRNWIHQVECSKKVAEIINTIHDSKSIGHIVDDSEKVLSLTKKFKM